MEDDARRPSNDDAGKDRSVVASRSVAASVGRGVVVGRGAVVGRSVGRSVVGTRWARPAIGRA